MICLRSLLNNKMFFINSDSLSFIKILIGIEKREYVVIERLCYNFFLCKGYIENVNIF